MSATERLTEIFENSHDSVNGGLDVNIQSQTSVLFQYYLTNEIKTDITLTAEVPVDAAVINVSAGHGFTAAAGEVIIIRYGDSFEQQRVKSVATNAITIEMPIANIFPVEGTTIIRGNINMNVDGSSTPVDFVYTNPSSSGSTIPIDITKVIITMQHGANVPDDDKFGGLAALADGLYFRKINGSISNYGNYTRNSNFREVGSEIEYSDKAPAGTNGTNIIFDIEKIFGQVVRLDPSIEDTLVARVRDKIDAAAGMAGMTMSLVGAFTSGEA
jgi:hypothetical protein